MINKIFSSLKDNVVQKTANPFLGTFTIIWIIRNWKFVYSLFYFDKAYTLDLRLDKIASYFKHYSYFDLAVTIGISFLVLIITYTLLNLSRLIINFYEKMITPKVYEITDKSSVVLKSQFELIENSLERLEQKLQEEREARLKVQGENEILEKRLSELLTSNKGKPNEQTTTEPETIDLIVKTLNEENLMADFDIISENVLNKIDMDRNGKAIKRITSLGLLNPGSSGQYTDTRFYDFTTLGRNVHARRRKEQLK